MTATATEPVTTSSSDPRDGKAVVLYDGACPFCTMSIRFLKKLDWFGSLHPQNCRDTKNLPPCDEPLVPKRLIEEMHVVTPDRKQAFAGFRAFRWMSWKLPALWTIAPLLYVPGVPWLGQKIYLWIAANRFKLVPCKDGVCTVPGR